jgi:alpha-1,6-mannosyltransferase
LLEKATLTAAKRVMSKQPAVPPSPDSVPRAPLAANMHLVDTTMFWSAEGGGVARYLRSKHRWLQEHSNWQHTILVPGPPTQDTQPLAVTALPLPAGYRFPLSRSAAARAIVKLRPDVIEVGDPYRLAWSALDAAWQLGVPVTCFSHSNLEALAARFVGRASARAVRLYLRRLYGQFDAVFAASQWMVGELRDLGLDNVVYQPLGVDTQTFHPRMRDVKWRAELGIDEQAFVLIYAGRYAPEKNLPVLVDAVKLLGRDVVLVTLGGGPCPPTGERVLRLPHQHDAAQCARALASADLFVHAGEQETFGLAALESLACGTPVVARACAGITDLVDGRAAIGVNEGTAEAYAAAIAALRPTANSLRNAARRRAERFDADQSFERLLRRYCMLRAAVSFGEAETRSQAHAA